MTVKPCPPCCTSEFSEINVPDNFFGLTTEEQRNLLSSLLNSHPEWDQTINELIKFLDDGNELLAP
ncbi:MAG TPA: hypothetical protein VEV83_15085 [Parafilimonas sp.]|nr:hypothetical protein [Parafilimonas sp.]